MTVPGKGGRPRKWRSDSDRVRAYRARQRGEGEPPTVEQAIEDDEGSATAWRQLRDVTSELDAVRREVEDLRAQLATRDREISSERSRSTELTRTVEALETELEKLRSAPPTNVVAAAGQGNEGQPSPSSEPRMNRQQRRRAERDAKRRGSRR